MSPAPRALVAANWKMHFVPAEAVEVCRRLAREVAGTATEVVLLPSFPLLPAVAAELAGSAIAWGGQDLHPEEKGAHTGDVSGAQLAACLCTWTLCGHSERRRDYHESDVLVGAKARAARRHGLLPLVCVGETREERRAGRTFEVLARQLDAAVAGLDRFAVAYEPVWAIGTGETASPETAQEAHAYLRSRLAELEGPAGPTRILYGGSVTPDNARDLFSAPDVDGFLVGGASLDPDRFLAIIRACG